MNTSTRSLFFGSVGLALLVVACGDDGAGGAGGGTSSSNASTTQTSTTNVSGSSTVGQPPSSSGSAVVASSSSTGAGEFTLTSTAYGEGEAIPKKYECAGANPPGDNVSPPLAWTAGPAGTLSYAIVMRDLDFQNGFLHWVMWDVPADVTSLPEDVDQTFMPAVPAGAKQAPFNGNAVGYYGPCSPNSTNTYEITVYAIDVATLPGLDEDTSKQDAAAAIVDAALASAKLAGES